MSKVNKKTFKVYKDEDGLWYAENNKEETRVPTEFAVKRPNRKVEKDAQTVYNKEFRQLVTNGALLQVEVDQILRDRNLWDDTREAELKGLQKEISDSRTKLTKGGSKHDAYILAVKIIKTTEELNKLSQERNAMNSSTAESQAENARFNYFIAHCTFYNEGDKEGRKYFDSYEKLMENEEDNLSTYAGLHLMELVFQTTEFRKKLPEYKFLLKYGYCDDELRLKTFDQRHYVDLDGNKIDKDGYFVNDAGQRVDLYGNLVENQGVDDARYDD